MELMPINRVGCRYRLQDFSGDDPHILKARCPGQHHDEFVTALARHRIAFADTALDALGHDLQQVVAHAMPQGVVDGFEIVQIDEQQADMLPRPFGLQDRLLRPVLQQNAIGQPGQCIMARQMAHAFFNCFAL